MNSQESIGEAVTIKVVLKKVSFMFPQGCHCKIYNKIMIPIPEKSKRMNYNKHLLFVLHSKGKS